jgi:chemotaxis protein methyltransferase CheR
VQEAEPELDPVEKAQELLEYGRSEEARDLLLGIVHEGPVRAHVCELLGKAFANLGCWEDAEHWCYRAVSIDRLCLGAYYTLALVLQHAGQLQRAIEAMRTVVYIDRSYVLGHYGLADLYRSNGQFPQALKSLDNARRLLASLADDEVIPDSGGTSVSRLRTAVIHQQLQWRSEAISGESDQVS